MAKRKGMGALGEPVSVGLILGLVGSAMGLSAAVFGWRARMEGRRQAEIMRRIQQSASAPPPADPGPPPDDGKGMDWNVILLYGGVGVGAAMLLSSVMGRGS